MSLRTAGWVGLTWAAWLATGCSATPTDGEEGGLLSRSDGIQARPGVEVALGVGEDALWEEAGVSVRYLRLVGDSRCPLEAVCVWEGDAAVLLRVSGGSMIPQDVTLHTTLSAGPRRFPVGSWTLELVRVDPYPSASATPDPGESRAVLRLVAGGG